MKQLQEFGEYIMWKGKPLSSYDFINIVISKNQELWEQASPTYLDDAEKEKQIKIFSFMGDILTVFRVELEKAKEWQEQSINLMLEQQENIQFEEEQLFLHDLVVKKEEEIQLQQNLIYDKELKVLEDLKQMILNEVDENEGINLLLTQKILEQDLDNLTEENSKLGYIVTDEI